jgi:cytochrome c oxidase assembly factor CtaG
LTLGEWQLDPLQVGPIVVVGAAYAARAATLAAKGRPVPRWRRLAFAAGLAVALLALVSPIDYLGENRRLWIHMVQHLMLGDLAPLLVVLGLTGPLLRPLLAVRVVRRARGLAHPFVALPLWVVDLYVWHLRVLYQAALRHDGIHALEHLCFFACGALMWAAVLEPLPGPVWFGNGAKAVYTLIVRVAGGVLGTLFIWAGHVFYPYYAARELAGGTSALTDQRIAGAIMFTEGSVVTLVAFVWLFLRFAREAELRQRLIERDVDEVLAARAARYGRSARLRDLG